MATSAENVEVKIEDLEPEMEALLQRLVPNIVNEWEGANKQEIQQIEKIVREVSGEDLPKFYRWFLMRMGQSMGPLRTPGMDYSALTFISKYNEDKNKSKYEEDSKFLLIGHCSEEVLPLNMYYDFRYPARDDARVTKRAGDGGDDFPQFETFREMIAWNTMLTFRVEKFPESCEGTLHDDSGENVFLKFAPVMSSLGFTKPSVSTGPLCGLYESGEAAMVTLDMIDFEEDESDGFAFILGGRDQNVLRTILGTIATETDLILDVKDDPRQLKERS